MIQYVANHRWSRLRADLADPQLVKVAQFEFDRVRKSWKGLHSEDFVRSLLVQIAVIGNARTGYIFDHALREPGRMTYLLKCSHSASACLHSIARVCGVRFVGDRLPNAKVTAWCAILQRINSLGGVDAFQAEIGEACRIAGISVTDDRSTRDRMLALSLPMLGRKSWSDWLNNCGLTRHLLAIDTRLVNVWRIYLRVNITLEDFQKPGTYLAWEDSCNIKLALPLGITLSELDKRLFMLPTIKAPRP